MILLDRIRYIAGFPPGRNRARWWPVGALALFVPAAVWLSSMSMGEPAPGASKGQPQAEEQPSAPSPSDRKLDHLLKAAKYLQAAGFEQEAKRCRGLAGQEGEALLLRIEALEAEIERLRGQPLSPYGSSIDQVAQSVQQVLVHVKIMEISRSKLRQLGFDWATVRSSDGSVVRGSCAVPSAAGKGYGAVGAPTGAGEAAGSGGTFRLDVMDGDEAFFRILESLREDHLARILSEPTFVTISGRPAFCRIGGEIPIFATQGHGTAAVEYKEYGTRLDAVPIVLSNGRLRMEVRMRVTELDWAKGIQFDGQPVPSFNTHEVDTGVEMQAGQTLVICGLAQNRAKAATEEPPTADKSKQPEEEVELLVLVTPELVDPEAVEEIAYSMLRSQRRYSSPSFDIVVKDVEGRRLIRPVFWLRPGGGRPPISFKAEEAELRTDRRENLLKIILRNGKAEVEGQAVARFPDVEEFAIPLWNASPADRASTSASMDAVGAVGLPNPASRAAAGRYGREVPPAPRSPSYSIERYKAPVNSSKTVENAP